MRVAAIDCGTNSVRLLVSEDGRELTRDLVITRLGQGVDARGRFDAEALARTFTAAEQYAQVLTELQVPVANRRFVATSAARDASNRDEFYAGIEARLGVRPEIIAGEEEARLSYLGATAALPSDPGLTLVLDIGGGSTELALGRGERLVEAVSLDIGSVRIKERFFRSDPPTDWEITGALLCISDLIDDEGPEFDEVTRFLGVGGTATCLSALHQQLAVYDRNRVHGSRLTVRQINDLANRLVQQSVAEIRQYPTMPPGRADVIAAGSMICLAVAARVPVDLIVSEADLLDGIVAELLSRG